MKNFQTKCACSAAGVGICLCIIFMSIAIGGTAVVGISKGAAMADMGNMGSGTQQNEIISFFSGFWGEVILLISYSLMFFGVWSSGNRRVLPIAIGGAAILYVSMYAYFSVALEVIGSIVIAFAFASAFSDELAKKVRLSS